MKKIFFSGVLLALALTSCSDYLDVNENQNNRPNFESLSPKQMLAGVINNYTTYQDVTLATYGNRLAYAWGLNSGFTSTDAAYTHRYDSNSYSNIFESNYLFADNCQDILDKKTAYPEYSYHFGIAKVFKVMFMDYATAMYGDVPYSEAFNSKIATPKYDDDKKIIPALFSELDEARAYLAVSGAKALGNEDIVFKGNLTLWNQFINTVELKLLLRLSKTTDATLVALRTARFAKLQTQTFINQDVTVDPGYYLGSLPSRNPIFRSFGRNEGLNDWLSANRANAAGDFIAQILNGSLNNSDINSTGVVDPRRARMFTLVGGKVVGNTQGVFPLTAISRFSTFYFGRTTADTQGDTNAAARNAFLMLNAESKFLQAEAIQRGYLPGNAQQVFNDGITASFNFYSTGFGTVVLTPLDAAAYIAATDSKNGLGWTGSTDKVNAIITQKYLALAQWHGIELYIDHLRTGFPKLPLPVGVNNTTRPNRLIYPSSEYSTNSSNVPNITNDELFTVNAKTPYYLQ